MSIHAILLFHWQTLRHLFSDFVGEGLRESPLARGVFASNTNTGVVEDKKSSSEFGMGRGVNVSNHTLVSDKTTSSFGLGRCVDASHKLLTAGKEHTNSGVPVDSVRKHTLSSDSKATKSPNLCDGTTLALFSTEIGEVEFGLPLAVFGDRELPLFCDGDDDGVMLSGGLDGAPDASAR